MGVAGHVTKKAIIQNETDIFLWNVSHTTGRCLRPRTFYVP